MVDPYAPPQETATRPPRPGPHVEPPASATQAFAPSAYDPPVYEPASLRERELERERDRVRDRPWRRDRDTAHEPRTEPARLGLFWTVAAVGIGLLCLARLMLFFVVSDDLPDDQVAAALFGTLGLIALAVGLALAAVLQRGLSMPWRVALVLGAGYFAAVPGSVPVLGFGGLF